ncbi:MAG: type II secretion system F family protein [Fimbriimonadaceae bacterium]|nr:type II secretion system F family protein [Fimbriimonadaceae bacterium]
MVLLLSSPLLLVWLQVLNSSNKMLLGGAVLCGVALVWTIRGTFSAPVSRSTLSRLQNYIDREENLSPLERLVERAGAASEPAAKRRKREKGADLLPTVSRWIGRSRSEFLNKLSSDLTRIGANWRASEVLYASAFLAMFMFMVVGVLMQRYLFGIIFAVGAMTVPFTVVKFKAKRWMGRFETQLADTLLLMSNATQAGYGFQQAMEMVAREGQPPMADEFLKMSQEVQLGVPIADALQHMAERVQNADFSLATTAIVISMEVGGALSEILRSISETIRERVRIRGEIGILTAQGKMTGLMLSALPVGMFFLLNLVGSDPQSKEKYSAPLLDGKNYPIGPKILAAGFVSQMIGYFFINRIVNIEI